MVKLSQIIWVRKSDLRRWEIGYRDSVMFLVKCVAMQDCHYVWNSFPDTDVSGTQFSNNFKEDAKWPCWKNSKSVQRSRNYKDGWMQLGLENVLSVAPLHTVVILVHCRPLKDQNQALLSLQNHLLTPGSCNSDFT